VTRRAIFLLARWAALSVVFVFALPAINNENLEVPMPYKITDDCTSCGACASECPVEAIKEGKNKYVINQDECTDCGSCVDACPADAIVEA